ncbi:kynureninase [Peribacillus frigoritolerans]|jgi:kynureninase
MSTKEYAKTLDQEDPLVSYREEFYLTPGMINMEGNSLGDWKSMGSMAGRRVPSPGFTFLRDWVN